MDIDGWMDNRVFFLILKWLLLGLYFNLVLFTSNPNNLYPNYLPYNLIEE